MFAGIGPAEGKDEVRAGILAKIDAIVSNRALVDEILEELVDLRDS